MGHKRPPFMALIFINFTLRLINCFQSCNFCYLINFDKRITDDAAGKQQEY